MKTSILVAAVVACTLVAPMASAQDKAAPTKPAMSMPMDAHMSEMKTNMALMQSQMDTIHATTNPKERQKLMQAHMKTMQDNMAMMRSMSTPMTMHAGQGCGMAMGGDKGKPGDKATMGGDLPKGNCMAMGGDGKPGDKGMMGGDMMKHHHMMEERMGMMQTMMEQMLHHQQMMESMPTK